MYSPNDRLGEILDDLGEKRKLAKSARSIARNLHQPSVKAELEQLAVDLDREILRLEEEKAGVTGTKVSPR